MHRASLVALLGMWITGCIPFQTTIEGTSDQLAWYVTDLQVTESDPRLGGESQYSCILVLTEKHGTPIMFTHRTDTIYATGLTVLRSVDHAITLNFKPYEERRIPLTFTWECVHRPCLNLGSVAPIWTITLSGRDGQGNRMQAVIQMRLPPNPNTSRKRQHLNIGGGQVQLEASSLPDLESQLFSPNPAPAPIRMSSCVSFVTKGGTATSKRRPNSTKRALVNMASTERVLGFTPPSVSNEPIQTRFLDAL
jgi:hypothetical protein